MKSKRLIQIAVKGKIWREENKVEKAVKGKIYREANKGQKAITNRAWDQANPERRAAHSQKRRALKRNAEGSHTHTDITNLIQTQDSKCVYCQIDLILHGKGRYHLDHRLPLSLGGSNYPSNLQLLCPICNSSKHNTHPDVYEKRIGFTRNQNKEL